MFKAQDGGSQQGRPTYLEEVKSPFSGDERRLLLFLTKRKKLQLFVKYDMWFALLNTVSKICGLHC